MLFLKSRVEEDLEKIRNVNLPHNERSDEHEPEGLKLEKNDVLAMILAVFSLIIPYFAAFVAIMAGVVFLLGYVY